MGKTDSLRELFEAALALPASARVAYLDAHCTDAETRARLERMLSADADVAEPVAEGDLDRLARAIGERDEAPALPPGSRLGPFVLVRVIGEGGSSTVFHASRAFEGATQHVALKLMRQSLHSPEAQRRFGREQRALIQLRHPNIARMIEGGVTDTGLPYIALELVAGTTITEYARDQRLSLPERLRLFVVVCHAVDSAHRALIVHRDLKPSNVMVTDDGEVKLLDFGVAKLLAEEEDASGRTLLPAFTPAYAAPEQRSGGVITTATDVYALGVLLGELVTGQRVNDGSGRTPSAQISETTEPGVLPASAPVTRRQVRGDLDAIVLKAVEPDAARRYASAGTLADDVERLLAGQPVVAHRATRWYRTRKFVGRHTGAVASTVAFVLAVLAALGLAVWQARVARDEARRANEQTRHALAIRDFLVTVFASAQSELPREKRPTVEELVDDASTRALADTSLAPATRTDLLLTLARVGLHVGAHAQALALLDRAQPDVDQLYPQPGTEWLQVRLLRAEVLFAQAQPRDALGILEPLHAALSARADAVGVEGLIALANALYGSNRHDDAQAIYAEARDRAAAVPERAEELTLHVDTARAESLVYAQKFAEGLAVADAAWQRWNATRRPPDRNVLNLLASISTAAEARGDSARADQAYRDAIALAERVYTRPHPDTAWVVGMYGSFLVGKARYDDAEPYIVRALAMRRALLGDAHPDTLNALAALGRLRSGQVRRDEARTAFADGVAVCEREQVKHNVCPRLLGSLAQMMLSAGELDAADATAQKAVAMQRALTGADSPQLASALGFLARVQVKRGEHAQAIATTDELLRIAERSGNTTSKDVRYGRFQRALALFALGRQVEALDLITAVVAEQKSVTPDEKTTLFSMLLLQARALSQTNRFDQARAVAVEALAIERKPQPLDTAIVGGLERLARTGRGY